MEAFGSDRSAQSRERTSCTSRSSPCLPRQKIRLRRRLFEHAALATLSLTAVATSGASGSGASSSLRRPKPGAQCCLSTQRATAPPLASVLPSSPSALRSSGRLEARTRCLSGALSHEADPISAVAAADIRCRCEEPPHVAAWLREVQRGCEDMSGTHLLIYSFLGRAEGEGHVWRSWHKCERDVCFSYRF